MKIMVDIDNVILKCDSPIYSFGNVFFAKSFINKKLRYFPVDTYVASQYKNRLSFLNFCNKNKLFPLKDCIKTLQKWQNQDIEIHLVSKKPKLKSFQKCTVDWLQEHHVPYQSLILDCSNKAKYCLQNEFDLVIDDSVPNCTNSAILGIPAILLTQSDDLFPTVSGAPLFVTQNWSDIDKIVQNLNDCVLSK